MKVLKVGTRVKHPYPKKRKIQCYNCLSKLKVDIEDCHKDNNSLSPMYYAICPICNNRIYYCECYPALEARKQKENVSISLNKKNRK